MQVDMRNCLKIFNSRPLVEVDLTKIANGALVDFQLTTSRGGRQDSSYTGLRQNFFNSRPLVEVDRSEVHRRFN